MAIIVKLAERTPVDYSPVADILLNAYKTLAGLPQNRWITVTAEEAGEIEVFVAQGRAWAADQGLRFRYRLIDPMHWNIEFRVYAPRNAA